MMQILHPGCLVWVVRSTCLGPLSALGEATKPMLQSLAEHGGYPAGAAGRRKDMMQHACSQLTRVGGVQSMLGGIFPVSPN